VTEGWLCPRCDVVNAPSVMKCGCAPKTEPWYERQARDMRAAYEQNQRAQQVANDAIADKVRTWPSFGNTCNECLPYKNVCRHVRPKAENDK